MRRQVGTVLALAMLAGCPHESDLDLTRPDDGAAEVAGDGPTAGPIDWRGRSIYFVMTDRFANGDPANDDADGFAADRAARAAWHGGDLQGVIDRLDYIAGMGFDGIWLTPIVRQHARRGYHGYWAWDWSQLDPHLGDLAKLHELIAAAHARGIAVMIDTVANHTGPYDYTSVSFPDAAMYHHNGGITDYGDQLQVENNDLSNLDDLDQAHPVVRQRLLEHVRWLVHDAGADGLRVDTVKHVPLEFWRDYVAAASTFTLGEVFDGRIDTVAPYSHVLSATLDYPLFFALRDVFAKGGSARQLGGVFARDDAYGDPALSGVFVDNHDQRRFLCDATGDKLQRLRLALAFALTARGIPIVYYGTEQGFASCTDNREDLFDAAATEAPLYRYLQQLHAIRAQHPALRVGVQRERWQDDTAYAFERTLADSTDGAIVGFNLSGGARTLSLQHLRIPAGTELVDALGGATAITVSPDGRAAVAIAANSAVILVPR